MDRKEIMGFPCSFPIKAMGSNTETFEGEVVSIVRRHVPKLGEGAVVSRPSRNGNYLSVTVTFMAESKEQLDNLYIELNKHPDVKMVL